MKLEAILGTLLLGSLIACGGGDDKPADAAAQPAAATTPKTSTDETSPASDTTANSNTSTTDPATSTTDPATTDPATEIPPAPVVQTCETLAAAAPAGKLTDVKSVVGMYEINPVDVYATEDETGLHLILTETPSACLYHANNFQASKMNELSFDLPKTGDGTFAPGSFKSSGFNQETGNVCFADGEFNGVGTAWGGGSTNGKVTITTKTATLVEGTVALTTAKGKETFTFSAPICAKPAADADLTCCAGAE